MFALASGLRLVVTTTFTRKVALTTVGSDTNNEPHLVFVGDPDETEETSCMRRTLDVHIMLIVFPLSA